MVAAAAAAALFFRLVLAAAAARRLAGAEDRHAPVAAPVVDVAAADGGSMDVWMREHAMLARDGTLLGSAEEIEFARIHSGADAGR